MIKIGKIVNTHGIKGEMRIRSNSDFKEERFSPNCILKVKVKNEMIDLKIEKYYLHKTFDIVKFVGYDNINDVLKFKNCDVYGELLDAKALDEDEYFNYQLVDLTVKNQDGDIMGTVLKVVENPGSNLLRIKGLDSKEFLIPFNNHFIINVNLLEKVIEVEEIEGLR